jgi:hypothetical protein
MRHATRGQAFHARLFATLVLFAIGLTAGMAGLVETLTR